MSPPDLICFSHLRWDATSVTAPRIRRLLERASRGHRVFLVEQPTYDDARPHLSFRQTPEGVMIVVPTLPRGTGPRRGAAMQRELVDHLLAFHAISRYVLWYWTPTARAFTDHLAPAAIVYDVLDEQPARPAAAPEHEAPLLAVASLVFAATAPAYDARAPLHASVHHVASCDPADAAGWDRVWAAMARLLARVVDARPTSVAAAT